MQKCIEKWKEGVFLPPSQFEGTFLSTAHMKEDIEKTIQAFDTALSRINKYTDKLRASTLFRLFLNVYKAWAAT